MSSKPHQNLLITTPTCRIRIVALLVLIVSTIKTKVTVVKT